MGTIGDKLDYLSGTKTAIKNAIVAKGVSVSDNDTFRSYATKIGNISGNPNLQDKAVTITTNTTTNIEADSGYDGLNSVAVTTNVTSSTFVVPTYMKFGSSTWSSIPSYLDFSNLTIFTYMFSGNSITEARTINTSKGTLFSNMFQGCSKLVTVNQLDTSKGTEFNSMFATCTKLENIPQFDFSSMTNNYNMFQSCPLLSNQSLNNILGAIAHGTSITNNPWKNLKRMGITQAQATICQSLSNWTAFIQAGWSSGY